MMLLSGSDISAEVGCMRPDVDQYQQQRVVAGKCEFWRKNYTEHIYSLLIDV